MSSLRNRVGKIEAAKRGKHDPNWHIVDECGHCLHVDLVENNPDLRLVQQCDTEPYTFACIQRTIAYADRDERLLNRWWAQSCKPKPPRLPDETEDEWVLRYARCVPGEREEEKRREEEAVQNARARVAAEKQAKTKPKVGE